MIRPRFCCLRTGYRLTRHPFRLVCLYALTRSQIRTCVGWRWSVPQWGLLTFVLPLSSPLLATCFAMLPHCLISTLNVRRNFYVIVFALPFIAQVCHPSLTRG